MTTEVTTIRGIPVEVVRKDIRNVHLAVYPPHGRVRIAVPEATSDAVIRATIAERLGWIRRHQAAFRRWEREPQREYVNGETHWFDGRRFRLRVVESSRPGVRLRPGGFMELAVRRGATTAQRAAVLDRFYRARIRELVPAMLDHWAPIVGVEVADWRIRRMKTRWGSARAESRRIWLNLELAKKPRRHLEYIVVHELLHLVIRHHDAAFQARLDGLLPHWRLLRSELGALPLGHEVWPD